MRRGFVALAVAAGLLLAGCSKDGPATVQLYARVPVPAVPDRTAPMGVQPGDGQYWATKVVLKDGQLVFSLAQAFFGPTCTTELGAGRCTDGFGTNEADAPGPAGYGQITITPSELTTVTVFAPNGQNYAIDGPELARLVGGAAPSSSAPSYFRYTPGPFLLSLSAGTVTAASEIATSA